MRGIVAPPVLALDLATACGWALVVDDRVARSGTLRLPAPGADGHPGRRYHDLLAFLRRGDWPEGLALAYEDVRSHQRTERATGRRWFATTAAHVYGGLRAVAEAWAYDIGARCLPVGVGEWKQGLGCAGGSHATKDEVMRRVRLLGFAPASQDEADAIGIGLYAARQLAWRGLGGLAMRSQKARGRLQRASR
ncbi:MAG: hypothetical protein IRZ13_10140 [Acetobacteraceae bacterium]|nr:hypothetical protein [Acetobacteraceae bacterium]